ncbi:MAG: hypothetical protein KF830_13855 [Planctomycetes bacterium]|nr:hypothetical protein [Planctomycetota bacterium]
MTRICPNPIPWSKVFDRLRDYARMHPCIPPNPPTPLILAGWAYSNDVEKMRRWQETLGWASQNGCSDLISLPETDFYCVDVPTSYTVGPLGGPMYRPWDFEEKDRPSREELSARLATLASGWDDIVGPELARATWPLAFSGAKARRLLVQADPTVTPPWGSWSCLSPVESERRMFTRFRASINKAIAPHEVDHIDFKTDGHAQQGAAADDRPQAGDRG